MTIVNPTTSTLSAPQLADLFGRLIAEARETEPSVRTTRIGSDAELNAIHAFVLHRYPDQGRAFLAWCKHRAESISGATANGVHVCTSARIYSEVRKNGIFVDVE